ncbi:MAG: radical SAM protein [Anaerolineales bacterium]
MVTKLHILLTYNCSLRCKHCYIFSDQRARGKISLSQISQILHDGTKIPGIRWVYFGGGEPFTQYPLLLNSVQRARKMGYDVGVETNGYFARTIDTGIRFLKPLAEMGVNDIRISIDRFHYKNPEKSPARKAMHAARKLGLPTTVVRISFPNEQTIEKKSPGEDCSLDEPLLMFSGRAVEFLSAGRKTFRSEHFSECPRDDLTSPDRLYIDAYGFVQICPGIAIGNIHKDTLKQIIDGFHLHKNFIVRVLDEQGPSGLIQRTNLSSDKRFVDACHCCYTARLALINNCPETLGPPQVYGF